MSINNTPLLAKEKALIHSADTTARSLVARCLISVPIKDKELMREVYHSASAEWNTYASDANQKLHRLNNSFNSSSRKAQVIPNSLFNTIFMDTLDAVIQEQAKSNTADKPLSIV